MGNFIYPDSETRKMYGEAGRKARAQAKRFNEILSREQGEKEAKIASLKSRVNAYQSLAWYKKIWLAIKELFGRKEPIITDSL